MLNILFALSVIGLFVSPVMLIIGLISPKTINKYLHKHFSRKGIAIIFTSLTILFFVLACLIAVWLPKSSENETAQSRNNSVQSTPIPSTLSQPQLSQSELDYINQRKDLISKFLAQDNIVQNDTNGKASDTKLVSDFGNVIGVWNKLLSGQWVSDPPASFKSYDGFLDTATQEISTSIEQTACGTAVKDPDTVTLELKNYNQALSLIKNQPIEPNHNYDDLTNTLLDIHRQVLFGAIIETDRCRLPLNADEKFTASTFLVTNNDNIGWTECSAIINKSDSGEPDDTQYTSDSFTLGPHQTEQIGWLNFVNYNNARFNYFLNKPESVTIDCTANNMRAEY